MTTEKSVSSLLTAADIRDGLGRILRGYVRARSYESIGKSHPLWVEFDRVSRLLARSDSVQRFPEMIVRWSVGQGAWATVPWIAALDTRETRKTSEGTYVIYLFCADMSGVYLTLNQGTSWAMTSERISRLAVLRERTRKLRLHSAQLERDGFVVGPGIRLKSDRPHVAAYEDSTVAFKFYPRKELPSDAELLQDLTAVLSVYEQLVPSRRIFDSGDIES